MAYRLGTCMNDALGIKLMLEIDPNEDAVFGIYIRKLCINDALRIKLKVDIAPD